MFLHINDTDLYYEKIGVGQPLILLHGNSESHKIFDKIVEPLSKQFTVYSIDSRGQGDSSRVDSISFQEMADDTISFIKTLQIHKPVLYGFSDGGIIGLLIASQHPDLLLKLIISGANVLPAGIKVHVRILFSIIHFFTRDPRVKMMLTEPDITASNLTNIDIPTLVLVGSRDAVKESDTQFIVKNIPDSILRVLKGEGHMSYVVHSPKLIPIIQNFCNRP